MNITTSIKSSTILLTSALLLAACGGSDNSDSATVETLTGVFIDAPVQGLGYQTPNHQGTTNEKGEFTYQTDETVSFFFNGIDLGSAPAQAKFPVTLLPNSPKLAQIFQTLDHNADPAKIDISGITLGAALKAQLENVINNKAGTPDLEAILTDAQLATLQTSNNITLVNQTLVDETTAADHLSDNIDPIAFSASDFSNKLVLDSDGGGVGSDMAVITFNSSGSGQMLGLDDYQDGRSEPFTDPFSWSVNNDGTANITFPGDSITAKGTKLSESDNRSVIHVDLGDEGGFIREWRTALPLKLADLDGKNFDVTLKNDDCTSTFSFIGSALAFNEQCPNGLETQIIPASAHSSLNDVIVLKPTHQEYSFDVYIALVDGTVADGKYVLIEYDVDSDLDEMQVIQMTETDSPLAAQ